MGSDRVSRRLRVVQDLHRQWRAPMDPVTRSTSKRLRYLAAIADVQHLYLQRQKEQVEQAEKGEDEKGQPKE